MSAGNVVEQLEGSPVGMGLRKVAARIKAADFTDNANTTADYTLDAAIPAGAFMIGTKVTVIGAFDEDTSAVITVGKSAGEDEFTDGGSVSVLAVAVVGESAEDPMEFIAAEQSVYVRLTGNSDATLLLAGGGDMLVEVFYLSTDLELGVGYPNPV